MKDHRPTREQRRKRGQDSQMFARRLSRLPPHVVAKLRLPDHIMDQLNELLRIRSPIARRRQERRLAGVLRDEDVLEIERAIERVERTDLADARTFQQVEYWRAALIGKKHVPSEFIERYANAPVDRLDALVENAQREETTSKPKGAKRALFRFLREEIEASHALSKSAGDDGANDSNEPDDGE